MSLGPAPLISSAEASTGSGLNTEWDAATPVSGIESEWEKAAPVKAEQRSVGEELARQAGLTLRAGIKAAGALGEIMGLGNVDRLLKGVLPEPETSTEKAVGAATEGVASAMLPGGLAKLAKPVTAVGTGIAEALQARMGAQAVSGALGGGAGEVAAQEGAGPVGQAVTSLAAGMVPFAVPRARVPGTINPPAPVTPLSQEQTALQAARDIGYVLPPTQVNPSPLNRLVEGWAGKTHMQQELAIKDQPRTDDLARRAIGLSKDAPINDVTLEAVRAEAGKPYAAIKSDPTPLEFDTKFMKSIDGLVGDYSKAKERFPGVYKGDKVAELRDSILTDPRAVIEPKPGTDYPAAFKTIEEAAANQPVTPRFKLEQAPGNIAQTLEQAAADLGPHGYGSVPGPARNVPVPVQAPPSMTMTEAMELVKTLRYRATSHLKSFDNPENRALGFAERNAAEAVDGLIERTLQQNGKGDLAKQYREGRTRIAQTYDIQAALNDVTGNVDARKLASIAGKKPFTAQLKDIANFASATARSVAAPPSTFGGHPGMNPLDIGLAAVQVAHGHPGTAVGTVLGRPIAAKIGSSDWYQNRFVNVPGTPKEPSGIPPALLELILGQAQRR